MVQHPEAIVPPADEPFIDLVQVRARGAFGTGLLVGPGLVLTALHCVCDPDAGWRPRADLGVYLLRDLRRHEERHFDVCVVWPCLEGLGKDPPDVAVLWIKTADPPTALVEHRFGELPRTPTAGSARGFPKSAKGPQLPGGRTDHDQPGRVHYTSLIRRTLTIDATGRHDLEGRDRWAGLSGGPLLVNGFIVGVMREVPDGWKGEAIEAEPLPPLLRDEAGASLRAFLGVKLPLAETSDPVQAALAAAYAVVGTEAAAASRRTFDAVAAKPFYGRSGDLAALDAALAEHDRGVLLVRGEAGLGKSRLTALWAERRATVPRTTTLRHAFSVREPMAGTRAAMVANLVRQAAGSLGPNALGGGDPGDAARLADRLASLLAADRPQASRLVVVLDALDEASEPIEPWPTSLGRGVFVFATCRAEVGEEPRVLRLWRERATEDGALALYYMLPPLDAEAIATWLATATDESVRKTDALVERVVLASEGVPLFASYLIPDAIEALRGGAKDPFPASFDEYARQRLTELQDRLAAVSGGAWSWSDVLNLFALLCVAKVPLLAAVLRRLVGTQRLDGLDQRAERWLWRRDDGASAVVSFAHPRLAAVFRAVLPRFEVDVHAIEKRLMDACTKALAGEEDDPLRGYALAWLPAHLVGLGRFQEAAALLGDGAFLVARLAQSPTVATAHATASETIKLGTRLAEVHPTLADWRRFWAETEVPLAAAIERASSLGLTAVEAFAQLARSRFGPEAPAFRPLADVLPRCLPVGMRLARGCGFRRSAPLRSLDNAHFTVVSGVLALADGLVSWGGDGAIRLWTHDGEARPGGAPDAHPGGVEGMLALADGLVSWGGDGAIRFWTRDGKVRPGGALKAHRPHRRDVGGVLAFEFEAYRGGVGGVLALADKLVSWGGDGAIRLWTRDGEARPGGALKAHRGGVGGVLALADGLVSWGHDGAIRLWTHDGEARPGGAPDAHPGGVEGVLASPGGLVSWGGDGVIRLWTRDGEARPGGALKAHRRDVGEAYRGGVGGVLALADGLVSWGDDGAIRFWTRDGKVRPGGALKAHRGGVEGVLALADGLVSWGRDGAIRLWTQSGEPRLGGASEAHPGRVWGVLALADGLVSWSWDGAIRLWTHGGEARSGGAPEAHRGGVGGVLALADGLVSWGARDGAIRFWPLKSEVWPGGAPEAHRYGIEGVLALADGLVSWGGDGAIRLWTRDGEARPGGRPDAHRGGVWGVLALADGLVSWGGDGAIRLWTRDGKVRPGGVLKAHRGGVGGVLTLADGLVSWGGDGAIRLWTRDGKVRPGGAPDAHRGGVRGMLALADRLVSWGDDRAIRFWTRDGEPWLGRNVGVHWMVEGVLASPGRLVSWGGDGAIRFWTHDGEARPGGASDAHRRHVGGVLALADGLVSWGEYDGAIRFWTHDGASRPGGSPDAHPGGVWGVLVLPDGLVSWGWDGAIRLWTNGGESLPSESSDVHPGGVRGVLRTENGLVSWGKDGIVRNRNFNGTPTGPAWIAPTELYFVTTLHNELWVGLLGRPCLLLRG